VIGEDSEDAKGGEGAAFEELIKDVSPASAPYRGHGGREFLGRAFGPFRIESHLGSGGMGAVYRATDERLNRRVAVKLLSREGEEDALRRELLLREARAAATIDHPNAVKIFDVGELDGTPYLVMELVGGTTLRASVRDASIPIERKIGWLIDVARALSAAHEKGVIHQDIKPDNVMLGGDDVIKVLDFGLARRVFESTRDPSGVESSWGVHGTAAYMAPERMRGGRGDALSDQFAWGVFAYELLTGVLPWSLQGGMAQLVNDVLTLQPEPIRSRRPDVPKGIDRVVMRALAKRPDRRFASMDDVIVALTQRGPGGDRASFADEAPWRRRPFGAGVVAAAALALAGFAAHRAPRRVEPASAPRPVATVQGASPPDYGSAMSSSAAAVVEYRAGVEAMRSAAGNSARRHFERALEIDPSFAAAHLRKVLATPTATDAERADVLKATELRDTLSEHDRALLQAIGPWVTVPQDAHEVERRLIALTALHPDADYLFQLCRVRILDGNYTGAIEVCRAAHERDPQFAAAVWLGGLGHLLRGDTREGMDALEECIDLSPQATSCLNDILQLTVRQGACGAAVEYAGRLVDVDPETPLWLEELGGAAYAMGRSMQDIRRMFAVRWDKSPDDIGRLAAAERLAVLAGDFEGAAAELAAWEEKIASNGDEQSHVQLFEAQAKLQREIGQESAFVERARAYLARRAAWSPSSDGDGSIFGLIALYRGGAMTRATFGMTRADWISHERIRPTTAPRLGISPGRPWITAYASAALTREDALRAIEVLPEYRPLPPERVRGVADDEPIGATFLLAGDVEGALPYLRRAASSCEAVYSPFEHTWANLELGSALEASDVAGACAAYKVVLDRWGAAPQSRSAKRARERWRRLRCP